MTPVCQRQTSPPEHSFDNFAENRRPNLRKYCGECRAQVAHPAGTRDVSSRLRQKISLHRQRQGRVIQSWLLTLVAGGPKNLVHKITGIALAQLMLQCVADKIDKILDYVYVIRHSMFFGHAAENLAELVV